MDTRNLGTWAADILPIDAARRNFRLWQPLAIMLLLAVLSACAAGPDYVAPETPESAEFANAAANTAAVTPAQDWWQEFGDATLSGLVNDALIENHDLRVARANLERVRALLRIERLDRLPVVTADGSVSRERSSDARIGVPSTTDTFYDAGFDARWELDLFGRVSRSVEAASAEYDAAVADTQDVEVIVAAEVARNYVELRGAQYQLAVARRNVDNQAQTAQLTQLLLDNGRGTQLDVSRAKAQLETTRASIPPLEAQVARAIHRLGVLTGRLPTALETQLAEVAPVPALPASIAIGDPAGLLRRRADVRAAERRLAAQTARVGIATADLFPRVTLTGAAGFLSASGADFGDSGSSYYQAGPFLSWGAFDLGRVRARIHAAEANVDASLANYERTVLEVLEETENSLVDVARSREREASLAAATTASEDAVSLARVRFQNGVDSFLNVLDAERRLFETQSTHAAAATDTALAAVRLYKALGGGWGTS
jgi:outer membrane protein, multidrug efflux system